MFFIQKVLSLVLHNHTTSAMQKTKQTTSRVNSAMMIASLQLRQFLFQHILKTKRLKSDSLSDEMLAHGLDPVQTQRVQHGTGALHDHQNCDGQSEPESEGAEDDKDAEGAFEGEGVLEGHVPEDDGELLMGEGKGPEAEVGGGVGDAVEAEFWSVVLVVVLR